MTTFARSSDPVADIVARHGSPSIEALATDIAGTYLRIGSMLGVCGDMVPQVSRPEAAALHSDLAALAATIGDQNSTREHILTATRFAAAQDDVTAMMSVDAQLAAPPGDNAIYAVYDLSQGPVTYDFTHYLMLAERFRRMSGRTGLYIIFVPASGDGFRHVSPRDGFMERDRKLWRLLNLLAPCAYLIPNCVGMTICPTREDASALLRTLPQDDVYPPYYSIETPTCPYALSKVVQQAAAGVELRAFQAPPLAANMVRHWFAEIAGTKPVVSITMRQSDFQTERNSNIGAWRQFAEFCVAQGFHPVFIPDTEALLAGTQERFDGFSVLELPALSVGYRMAIYQESFVNAMVNNGPHGLCIYHPAARSLVFKVLNPAVPTCTAAYLAAHGIRPDHQLPFSGPHQTIVWEFDDAEAIERAFTAMVEAVLAEPQAHCDRAIA
jgi:hypothetical protein